MRIAIIGRTQLLYETVRCLADAGHEIGCIITAPATPEYTRTEEDFRSLARSLGVPFICTKTLDIPEVELACAGLDLGVGLNWVSIIRRKHIDLFRIGILNSHHGDLPRYRGNACSNWAILNGEAFLANSIHLMEPDALDCGRIICQERFTLSEDTTITDVYSWAEATTPAMFLRAVTHLEQDRDFSLKFADPDAPESFRCFPRLPEDSLIDWSQSVDQVHRLIRAVCSPFPGAYTFLWQDGKPRKLRVLRGRIVARTTSDYASPGHVLQNDRETGESWVRCGEGVLSLQICRYEDEAEEFFPGRRWKSIRMRLGIPHEDLLWYLAEKLEPQTR